jgi:hypothetical protein
VLFTTQSLYDEEGVDVHRNIISGLLTFLILALLVLTSTAGVLILSAGPVSAAQDGDYAYSVSDGKANIMGYSGAGVAITIPSTLGGYPTASIGDFSFRSISSLTSVTIPIGVTSIGSGAFQSCPHLTTVNIPSSVTSIGMSAFTSCPSLTGIYVDTTNAYYAHADGVLYNKAITTLIAYPGGLVGTFTIPSGVISIGYGAFFDCTFLTFVAIPDSVTLIDDLAFGQCTNLVSAAIGNGVTSIGYQAFTSCHDLTSVTFGDSITTIEDFAFLNCTSLTSMTFLGLTAPITVGANWTAGTPSSLESHAYPASNFPSPGNYFNGLLMGEAITEDYTHTVSDGNATITRYLGAGGAIEIPATLGGYPVAAIGVYAFSSCSSLTSVTMPNSVTSIGIGAFNDCSFLTSVTMPNSVTTIGDTAFDFCTSLTSIDISDNVTFIGQDTFNACYSLTSVIIPDSVTSIRNCAFNSCTALTSIIIPNKVKTIGDTAFGYCISLASATIPNGVISIGHGGFQSCYHLTSVTIPASVTTIGLYAFNFCTSLTAINVDPSNPNYASINGILYNKAVTALIQFPAGKVGSFTVPAGIATIGNYSFASCASLTSVTFPSSVTSIGRYSFFSCSSLTSITFPGLTAPITVGANWIMGTSSSLRGHTYAASNFPSPGNYFNGLLMGAVIPILPGSPTDLFTSPGHVRVVLVWSAPVSDGNSTITNYNVYRSTNETGPYALIATPTELNYADNGLSAGHVYWYKVSATNAIGEGAYCSAVNATPLPPIIQIPPGTPTDLQVIAGDGQIMLIWNPPSNNGTSPISGYAIYRGTNPSSLNYLTTSLNANYTNVGLTNSQKYYYCVAARSNDGEGNMTESIAVTPIAQISTNSNDSMIIVAGAALVAVAAIGGLLYLRRKK